MTREEIEKEKERLERVDSGKWLLGIMEDIDHLIHMHEKHGGILSVRASSAQFDARDIVLDSEAKVGVLDVLRRQKERLERRFEQL